MCKDLHSDPSGRGNRATACAMRWLNTLATTWRQARYRGTASLVHQATTIIYEPGNGRIECGTGEAMTCIKHTEQNTPCRTRTCDHPLRRRTFYPTELRELRITLLSHSRSGAPRPRPRPSTVYRQAKARRPPWDTIGPVLISHRDEVASGRDAGTYTSAEISKLI